MTYINLRTRARTRRFKRIEENEKFAQSFFKKNNYAIRQIEENRKNSHNHFFAKKKSKKSFKAQKK
jgi:hypothetical protein